MVPPLRVSGLRVACLGNLILLLPWVCQTLQARKVLYLASTYFRQVPTQSAPGPLRLAPENWLTALH
jgi:hypothetical protein